MTTPEPDDKPKFTVDEAKALLKEKGFLTLTQRAFDDIIDEKYAKAYEKATSEVGDVDKLKKELEKANQKIEDLKKDKPDMIPKSEHEQLLKVEQEKAAKALEEVGSLKKHQVDNELLKAVGNWAVDPSDVLELTRGKFALGDDGKLHAVDDKGGKLYDKEGRLMTPELFYQDFQKSKPHLVKASNSNGAGSGTDGEGGKAQDGKPSWESLADLPMDQFVKTGGMTSASLPTA
jgi:hypothetical protein